MNTAPQPLLLSTYDLTGGAAKAAYRLHLALMKKGIKSKMWVQSKFGHDPTVRALSTPFEEKIRRNLDQFPLRFYPGKLSFPFNVQWLPNPRLMRLLREIPCDLVHLNWTGYGFVPIGALAQMKKPIVCTMHDSWVFTGGCNVPFECRKYQRSCGKCPILNSDNPRDLSFKLWKKKSRCLKDLPLVFVGPSKWMADCARSSTLLANHLVESIPNGLDTDVFRPIDTLEARRSLGLELSGKLVLFGAMGASEDRNKGLHHFLEVCNYFRDRADLRVAIFGSESLQLPTDYPIQPTFLGKLDDSLLSYAYSAADVMVVPSILENLPNTIMESMSCGTPVAAFDVGGVSDLIDHRINGYLARPFEVDDLALGISFLMDNDRKPDLALETRNKVLRNFRDVDVAQSYLTVYEELLSRV